eukprot:9470343-Pyramimonas_sp.AAC.1
MTGIISPLRTGAVINKKVLRLAPWGPIFFGVERCPSSTPPVEAVRGALLVVWTLCVRSAKEAQRTRLNTMFERWAISER